MKKAVLLGLVSVTVLSVVFYISTKSTGIKKKTIAIVTTLSHPALDSARRGFVNALGARKDIEIVDYNAQGNLQQANLIAHKIAGDHNVIGIFAIGTLAAQTVAKTEKTRPVVVAAVSDPKVIIPDAKSDNICGLSDAINADYQVDRIMKLMPHIASISLLYSPEEANSASMVKSLAKAIEERQVRVTLVGVHEPQQIMSGSHEACRKGDAVLIPLDNQLVSAMPAVIKATRSLPCPVITSNESPIHQGATLAFGVDYEKSGNSAGEIMRNIIDGSTTPKTVGFIDPKSIDLFINDRIVKDKGLALDAQSLTNVIHVGGEV